jgi:hypothetical protein
LGKLKKTASQTCHRKSLDENFKTKTSQKLQYTERERERESSSTSSSKKIGISAYFLMLESESS